MVILSGLETERERESEGEKKQRKRERKRRKRMKELGGVLGKEFFPFFDTLSDSLPSL